MNDNIFVEITKTKVEKIKIYQVKRKMFIYDEDFIRIRSRFKNTNKKCDYCKKPFVIGEDLALAVTNKKNLCICQKCADKFIKQNPNIEVITND